MPNWKKVITSGSQAHLAAVTASSQITINPVAASTEATLVIGTPPAGGAGEGGQIALQPASGYTSGSFIDIYQTGTTPYIRLLRGTAAASDALVTQWNLHTKQFFLPAYTSVASFSGTATALLAVNSSGDVITVSTGSGGGGGSGTVNGGNAGFLAYYPSTGTTVDDASGVSWDSVNSRLAVTGSVIATANGAMYFRGGDDAEFWDINVANTVGIYGQQTQGIGAVKLGSGGPTLYGSGSRLGIGTTSPVATVDINGNLYVASGITGSLLGTASFATTAVTASYVQNAASASFATSAQTANTASYILNAVSASFATSASKAISSSFATTASYATQAISASYAPDTTFPYVGSARISGSLGITGSFEATSSLGLLRNSGFVDNTGVSSIKFATRLLTDSANNDAVDWENRRALDSTAVHSILWDSRLLKIGGTPAAFTVDWGNGTLRDLSSVNSVDWVTRYMNDTSGNVSIDWENRTAYDSATSASINWRNRELNDNNQQSVISWGGSTGEFSTYKYNAQRIGAATRTALYTYNKPGGQFLDESYFDVNVVDNDLVFLETDGLWYQVDQATDSSTKMLGIAKDISSQTGSIITEGDLVVTTATGYPYVTGAGYGLPVYIREGTGTQMATAAPTTGYVRLLGHCYYNDGSSTEWIMKFRPSHEWVSI